MKINLINKAILSLTVFLSVKAWAFEGSAKKELLQDIKAQTKKCVVQIVSTRNETDNENVLGFKSVCKTLKIVSQSQALIFIDGNWLTATITESAESDGGDLDDLEITNAKNETLATKTNIAAYDSVLVAMAGDSDFKKIHQK